MPIRVGAAMRFAYISAVSLCLPRSWASSQCRIPKLYSTLSCTAIHFLRKRIGRRKRHVFALLTRNKPGGRRSSHRTRAPTPPTGLPQDVLLGCLGVEVSLRGRVGHQMLPWEEARDNAW